MYRKQFHPGEYVIQRNEIAAIFVVIDSGEAELIVIFHIKGNRVITPTSDCVGETHLVTVNYKLK